MIEGRNAAVQKVVYFLGNLSGIALAMYKCQVMGLLPTHPSDWLAFVEPQKVSHSVLNFSGKSFDQKSRKLGLYYVLKI